MCRASSVQSQSKSTKQVEEPPKCISIRGSCSVMSVIFLYGFSPRAQPVCIGGDGELRPAICDITMTAQHQRPALNSKNLVDFHFLRRVVRAAHTQRESQQLHVASIKIARTQHAAARPNDAMLTFNEATHVALVQIGLVCRAVRMHCARRIADVPTMLFIAMSTHSDGCTSTSHECISAR